MPSSIRPGDVLADRYRLVDLLTESKGGRFWRAHDRILERTVALHVIAVDDERAGALLEAAKRSAVVHDRRLLRVLDADRTDDLCFVVNEWGSGDSLDVMVAGGTPLEPRRAAWLVSEVAASIAAAHEAGVAHGRLIPENVLVDHTGAVRVIGFAVDAAMHGLPPGRVSTDVADLGGLLYCALTGRWPGASSSAVAPAPLEQGRVLRPRQVRAGIPRPLDALCDEVVNPYTGPTGSRLREQYDVASAQGISDYLCVFVGDATGLAAAEALAGHRETESASLPAIPDPVIHTDPAPGSVPETPPEQEGELPTEAGLPIFDDESDDVSWLTAPSEPAAPPPPFEEPPERPLFAPTPTGGAPERTPRPARPAPPTGYWPWDTGTGAGTGSVGAVLDDGTDDGTGDEVPGRSWLRLAAVIALCLVLLVAVVVAYNLGRGRTPLGAVPGGKPDRSPSGSASASPSATPITGVTATDFDPQGTPPEENPDEAPLAVDGDPTTSWRTLTYQQDFGPGGLKTGVGLVLDLGSDHTVSEVDLTTVGSPTSVSFYLTPSRPTGVRDLTPVATATVTGTRDRIPVPDAPQGRYLTVWLTSVPPVSGGFRGEIAEVAVRG